MEAEKERIKEWVTALKAVDPKSKSSGLAPRILKLTSLPKRRRVSINLERLNEHASEGENIIIPGKILGKGEIQKKFHFAAIECSGSAMKKLKSAGCSMVEIKEMLKKENVRLLM